MILLENQCLMRIIRLGWIDILIIIRVVSCMLN